MAYHSSDWCSYLGAPTYTVRGEAGVSITEPSNVDADDWHEEVHQSGMPVLVDFWHDACFWCKQLDPVYSQLAEEFVGKLKFAKMNVFSNERNNQLAAKFGVMGTPTMILFCSGRPIETLVGVSTEGDSEKRTPTHD